MERINGTDYIIISKVTNYCNKLLHEKRFGFQQQANSTKHAIIELTDQMCESFNENKFTISVFVDLSKTFDTVNHPG